MITKKNIQREPFLFQLIFDLFGPDDMDEVEDQQIRSSEFYVFLIFVTIAMFLLNYLVKEITA